MEREGHTQHRRAAAQDREAATAAGRRELLDRLEGAIQDSDTFRRYLDAQARFHRYSWRNVALILAQRPDATQVAGYRTWQSLGRQVRRGERGITIAVPLPVRVQTEDTDETTTIMRFGVGTVFDISQTDGAPLPEVAVPILEDDAGGELYDALGQLAQSEGLALERRAQLSSPDAMGFYEPQRKRILVREARQLQMTKTLAHELAHHFTGMHETYTAKRDEHKTVAEAVAYVVLAHFGLDSGTRSFPYIATWAKDTVTLRSVLGTIQGVAQTIISQLEGPDSAPTA